MPRMTSYQMSYILDIDIQRSKSPLIRWIEHKVYNGSGTDYGTAYPEVLEYVAIKHTDRQATSQIYYEVNPSNNSLCVVLPQNSLSYIIDTSRPKFDELETIKMVLPDTYKYLQTFCEVVKFCLDRPHSCEIEYHIQSAWCGCEKVGLVNYRRSKNDWEYWCGDSDRCCP